MEKQKSANNQTSNKLTRAKGVLLLLLITVSLTYEQYPLYYEVDIMELREILPNIHKIKVIKEYLRMDGDSENVLFYEDMNPETGQIEHKATLVRIRYGSSDRVTLISRMGHNDPLPFVIPTQETDQATAFHLSPNGDFSITFSFNKKLNSIRLYDTMLNEHTDPKLENLDTTEHPILFLDNAVQPYDLTDRIDLQAFFIRNRVVERAKFNTNGRITIHHQRESISVNNINRAHTWKIENSWISAIFGDTTEIIRFYRHRKEPGSIVKILDSEGNVSFNCDDIKNIREDVFLCFISGGPIRKYTLVEDTAIEDTSYQSPIRMTDIIDTGEITITQTFFTDSDKIQFIRGTRSDGQTGATFAYNEFKNEVGISHDISSDYRLLPKTRCKDCLLDLKTDGTKLRILKYQSFSGDKYCFVTKEFSAMFNDQCETCFQGYRLENPETNPTCVKICTGANERYEDGYGCVSCEDFHHCQTCSYYAPTCELCLEGYELRIPYMPGRSICKEIGSEDHCEFPKNHYPDPTTDDCIDCLTANNCQECQYPSGKCSQCSTNFFVDDSDSDLNFCHPCSYFIPNCDMCSSEFICSSCASNHFLLVEDQAVCQSCSYFIENCLECSARDICNKCVEGMVVDDLDPSNCIPESLIYFKTIIQDPQTGHDLVLTQYFYDKEGRKVDDKRPQEKYDKYGSGLFVTYSETTQEELETKFMINEGQRYSSYIKFSEKIKNFEGAKEIILSLRSVDGKIRPADPITVTTAAPRSSEIFLDADYFKESMQEISSFPKGIASIAQDSPTKETISMLSIALDPREVFLKATQFMKLARRFVFIDVEFGKALTIQEPTLF